MRKAVVVSALVLLASCSDDEGGKSSKKTYSTETLKGKALGEEVTFFFWFFWREPRVAWELKSRPGF